MLCLLFSFFAACGAAGFIWALLGWMLPPIRGTFHFRPDSASSQAMELRLRRFSWLVESGFVDAVLVLEPSGMTEEQLGAAAAYARTHPYIQIRKDHSENLTELE